MPNRVKVNINDRRIPANKWVTMDNTVTDGDYALTDGIRFMAPTPGLYALSATSGHISNPALNQSLILRNSTTGMETTARQQQAQLEGHLIPGMSHIIWLNEGDYLAYAIQSNKPQGSVMEHGKRIEIEFAQLNTGAGDVALHVEFASNDDNRPVNSGLETAVNREDGSLGLRANMDALFINKAICFPTPFNALTDTLEIQVSQDRRFWNVLFPGTTRINTRNDGLSISTAPYLPRGTNTPCTGMGLILSKSEGTYVQFGRDRHNRSVTGWQATVADWYWRVVKKTIVRL